MNVDDVQIAVEDVLDGRMKLHSISKTNTFAAEPEEIDGQMIFEETVSVRIDHTPYP